MRRLFIIVCFFLFLPLKAYAQSSYVLPYPSAMPGSFLYKPHLLIEKLSYIWHFGNLGKFHYNLTEADQYLVEAKTLFEYNQLLLASNSLKKSNSYFLKVKPSLEKAKKEGKDVSVEETMFKSASQKHIEVLLKLKADLPETFTWVPEKTSPTILKLHDEINSAISIRQVR